jgi:hypothetical protein
MIDSLPGLDHPRLIRGCWRQAGDDPGSWWDDYNGEPITLTPIGWTALPTNDEMAMLLRAAKYR